MTGVGSYRGRKKKQTECAMCGVTFSRGSLAAHMQQVHVMQCLQQKRGGRQKDFMWYPCLKPNGPWYDQLRDSHRECEILIICGITLGGVTGCRG